MKRFLSVISCGSVVPSREPQWTDSVAASLKRRDPRIWQLAHLAASRTLANAAQSPQSMVIGTALGALDETKCVLDGIYSDGFSSPRNFIASVHNSMAGKIALEFKIGGPNLTVCDGQNSFASAIATADLLDDKDFPVLLVVVDERLELLDRVQEVMPLACKNYLVDNWDEAAVGFLLGISDSHKNRIRSFGPFPVSSDDPAKECRLIAEKETADCRFVFKESCTSFVQPALCACDFLKKEVPSRTVLGSYSPVSKGAAIIELLIQ